MDYFNSAIFEQRPVVINLHLDEDRPGGEPWNEHFDPSLDLLFGKYGLPDKLWRGNSIYDNLETAPDALKQVLHDFVGQEFERMAEEDRQEMEETGEIVPKEPIDEKILMETHLESLRN